VSHSVLQAAAALREALAQFEPGLLSGRDCARVADELAATEKACAAARVLAAGKAVAAGAHREDGFQDGAAWLAQQSGTTAGQARQALDMAGRLPDCPDTKAALLAGDISLAQAGEIMQAQSERPGAEQALLPVARQGDLSRLREQAREHRWAHTQVEDLHRRQQQARFFRHWRDRLGMVCFSGALPPETGIPFVRRVERATFRARRQARQADFSGGDAAQGGVSAGDTCDLAAAGDARHPATAGDTRHPAATSDACHPAAAGAAHQAAVPAANSRRLRWETQAADALAALTAGADPPSGRTGPNWSSGATCTPGGAVTPTRARSATS